MKEKHGRKNISLGKLLSVYEVPKGLCCEAVNGWLQLDVIRPDVIRVRAGKLGDEWTEYSYAVVGEAQDVDYEYIQDSHFHRLQTAALSVEINPESCALTFKDAEGKILNQDDPAFCTSWLGQEVSTYKSLQNGERFVGLGEKTGPLDRRGRSYVNWNTDSFAYGPETDPLYLSAPFFMGIHDAGIYGIFLDNSHKTSFNFGTSNDRFAWFSAEDGQMDYYFFHQPTVAGILESYSWLTGRMPLPPKWSLGFQQCRYSYYPDKEVLRIAETFREKKIPADVIYLDIHYMDAFKVFTWHPERFPDPKGLCDALKKIGFKVVLIVDPGLKVEKGYAGYESGIKGDHFVKYPDGVPYSGQVWPGWSHFPDFTASKTREWWGDQFDVYTDVGIEGFWNDMNEPAAWGQNLPNLIEFDLEGEGATLKEARNLYGMYMAQATREGAQKHLGNKRPFILTRAGFSGVQRYAAVWTGDNVASDENMLAGHRLVNSLGLTGIPFAGYDIGGFVGEPSPALYARWMALATFTPFYRAHSMINTRDAEPWSFGEEVEDIARNYISLRYRLMPYIYSAFEEAAISGMPISRSLVLEVPHDSNIYDKRFDSQYLFGQAILVAPIASDQALAKVYLPHGTWYNWYTDERLEGGKIHIAELTIETLPLYIKQSAVIPMQQIMQHIDEQEVERLDLHVYAGKTTYTTSLYDDDGATNNNLTHAFAKRNIVHNGAQQELEIRAQEGHWESPTKLLRIIFHGVSNLEEVVVNGQKEQLGQTSFRLVEPVSRFDPFLPETAEPVEASNLPFVDIAYKKEKISIQYGRKPSK